MKLRKARIILIRIGRRSARLGVEDCMNTVFRVCKKVESKGRTTYNEVADEFLAEFGAAKSNSLVSLDESDVKNIRRRIYDSFNVLVAFDIITKVRKEIQWNGLPSSNARDVEAIKAVHSKLMSTIGKKAAYLKDLEDHGCRSSKSYVAEQRVT